MRKDVATAGKVPGNKEIGLLQCRFSLLSYLSVRFRPAIFEDVAKLPPKNEVNYHSPETLRALPKLRAILQSLQNGRRFLST